MFDVSSAAASGAMPPRTRARVADCMADLPGKREVHLGASVGRYQRMSMATPFGEPRISAPCCFPPKKSFGRAF